MAPVGFIKKDRGQMTFETTREILDATKIAIDAATELDAKLSDKAPKVLTEQQILQEFVAYRHEVGTSIDLILTAVDKSLSRSYLKTVLDSILGK